jgi:Ca2+-binding RTX toxin-like protein
MLTVIAATLLLGSSVALAVNKIGTNGPNTLRGTKGNDNLLGRGGQDDLFGLAGADNLLGGEGKDWLLGDQGGDRTLVGGPGNDGVISGNGSDNALGGEGNDLVWGTNGSDSVVGEEGADLLDGWWGSDRVVGNAGSDWLYDGPFHDSSQDTLSGGPGNDKFWVDNGPPRRDIVSCGGGFDRVAADLEDLAAADCEKVRRGPTAGEDLSEEVGEPLEHYLEILAPFPSG